LTQTFEKAYFQQLDEEENLLHKEQLRRSQEKREEMHKKFEETRIKNEKIKAEWVKLMDRQNHLNKVNPSDASIALYNF
jgi:hypothetical protein